MMSGVRASSMRIESTSSTSARPSFVEELEDFSTKRPHISTLHGNNATLRDDIATIFASISTRYEKSSTKYRRDVESCRYNAALRLHLVAEYVEISTSCPCNVEMTTNNATLRGGDMEKFRRNVEK
jgi:hypothetical protein